MARRLDYVGGSVAASSWWGRPDTGSKSPYRAVAFLSLLVSLLGCSTDPIILENGVPAIGAAGPVSVVGDVATIVFYVRDYEEDPVDVDLVAEVDESAVTVAHAPGSEGLQGLSSSFEGVGALHIAKWDIADIAQSASVILTLTPDDHEGGQGDPLSLGPFTLSEGLDETVIADAP